VSLTFETVAYGRPAAERLLSALHRAKGDDPLRPATVVVAANHVGVAVRRLLASDALGPACARRVGLCATSFCTVHRLAEDLAGPRLAEQGRLPASQQVVAAALRAALAQDSGVFASVADQPATEAALAATLRELGSLSDLARLGGQGPRVAELVRLHAAVRERLAPRFYDEHDLVQEALARLDADPSPARALGTVVCYLLRDLDRRQAELLHCLARHTEVVVLAGRTGEPHADSAWRRTEELLSEGRPAPEGPPAPTLSPQVRIVTCPDAEEEARSAVRAVTDAVRAGTPLERIAVLYSVAQPYARLVYEQLDAAGIACHGPSVARASDRVAGRALLGLLRLAGTPLRRDELFAWMASIPLLHWGRLAPVAEWEAVSREAMVVKGQDWDRLIAYADAPQRPARRAQAAQELHSFVGELSSRLALADGQRPWSERVSWATSQLEFLLGSRDDWPEAERHSAEDIQRALQRLGRLGSVEGPVGPEVFARCLEAELGAEGARRGRMGRGVTVGPLAAGVALDLDLAVVLGLAEGLCPAEVQEDPLLPDAERRELEGELALASDQVRRQHHDLLAVMAGTASVVLSVPRGDLRRSTERVPSRFVTALAAKLAGRPLGSQELLSLEAGPWLEHVASFEAGLALAGFPATDQEHRLRSLMAARAAGRLDRVAADMDDPVLAAGAVAMAARESRRFTRFDGNLAGLDIPAPATTETSATRLEEWACCPFAYFMHSVLGLEPVEDPALALDISPKDQGILVHEVLANFLREALRDPPSPEKAWTQEDRRRMRELAEEAFSRFEEDGRAPGTPLWKRTRRRLLNRLERFLDADSARRAKHGLHPVGAELGFGPWEDVGPAVLPLPDGRQVRFRGRLDRLDRSGTGTAYVVDYKTGRSANHEWKANEDPTDSGRHLQLVVYALAACLHTGASPPVKAAYWFLDDDEPGECPDITEAGLERAGQAVGEVVAAIEAGAFSPNPPASTHGRPCPYCSPDSAPTTELSRLLERKSEDLAKLPALARVLGLEPPDDDAGSAGGGPGG
jgi:ATP-dependent helicase/nuclease subunit B